MADQKLHPLTGQILQPLGVFRGRLRWPILGGAPDGDGGQGGGEGGSGSEGQQGGQNGGQGEGDLGDNGKKAIEAERATAKAAETARKAAEKRAADLDAELQKIRDGQKTAEQKAVDDAVKAAREEASNETADRYRRRIVTAEVRAAAGGRLADPADAVQLLDIDAFKLDDQDEVDGAAISKALDELLKAKPYLAGKSKTGNHDHGYREDGGQKPASLADAVDQHYKH